MKRKGVKGGGKSDERKMKEEYIVYNNNSEAPRLNDITKKKKIQTKRIVIEKKIIYNTKAWIILKFGP